MGRQLGPLNRKVLSVFCCYCCLLFVFVVQFVLLLLLVSGSCALRVPYNYSNSCLNILLGIILLEDLILSFPEIIETEETTSTVTINTIDITVIAVGVVVGAAILIAIAVVIATIFCWIKRKKMKSHNLKEKKTLPTNTEKNKTKETDF